MRVIKRLPKSAVFDYVTNIGDKRYHSKRRVYMVEEGEVNIIRSYDSNLD